MSDAYFQHPNRLPKNVPGPFYTLGDTYPDGTWWGQCLSCGVPEDVAPDLLEPLTQRNGETYFVRQPETDEEVERACLAIEVCCVDALRYGGRDPKILARLAKTGCCDMAPRPSPEAQRPVPPPATMGIPQIVNGLIALSLVLTFTMGIGFGLQWLWFAEPGDSPSAYLWHSPIGWLLHVLFGIVAGQRVFRLLNKRHTK